MRQLSTRDQMKQKLTKDIKGPEMTNENNLNEKITGMIYEKNINQQRTAT